MHDQDERLLRFTTPIYSFAFSDDAIAELSPRQLLSPPSSRGITYSHLSCDRYHRLHPQLHSGASDEDLCRSDRNGLAALRPRQCVPSDTREHRLASIPRLHSIGKENGRGRGCEGVCCGKSWWASEVVGAMMWMRMGKQGSCRWCRDNVLDFYLTDLKGTREVRASLQQSR